MENIRLLDAQTIDKIAAGEVVERPASVVKELLENSIDAKASVITVEIKNGGIDYIRVSDNGCGIIRSDVKTAFLRHATSKIRSAEDIVNVLSLGFRGEALSSVAAVSRVELLTKTKDDVCGLRYVIEGSRELVFEDAGVPDGTSLIVKNLFYNVPVRRKFLKTAMTEGGYISDVMEHIMLSHPEISFKYIVNGNVKLQSKGDGDLRNVIYDLYGKEVLSLLIPIDFNDDAIHIHGYIGKPELARSNRNFEIFFVNNRVIKSTLISRAIDEAYKPYLMLHKFPYAFLFLDVPSEMIDVNVHPTKMEIRFLEGERLYSDIVSASNKALSNRELIWDIGEEKEVKPVPVKLTNILPEPFETNRLHNMEIKSLSDSVSAMPYKPDIVRNEVREIKDENLQENFEQINFLSEEARKSHKLIGQIFDTYWLVEYDNTFYIIDQHAAHEKVRYERLLKHYRENISDSQLISPPVVITLSLKEENIYKEYAEDFRRAGFEIEPFGGNEYAIYGVPTELYGLYEDEYFKEMLDVLSSDRNHKDMDSILSAIASASCKGAIKAGNKISSLEADALIDELLSLDNPYNCPHGRPVIVSYSRTELEKKFKRIL